MKKMYCVFVVLMLVLGLVGCSAAKKGFEDGLEDGLNGEKVMSDEVNELATEILGVANGEDGVTETIFNPDEGYMTVKYQMRPLSSNVDKALRQLNQRLVKLYKVVEKVDEIETLSVVTFFPTSKGEWVKSVVVEVSRETLEDVDWAKISTVEFADCVDSYSVEAWLK